MSVNVNLTIEIAGCLHDKVGAVEAAIMNVLEYEQLDRDFGLFEHLPDADGQGGLTLKSATDPSRPVIISGLARFSPSFQKQLEDAAAEANGRPCKVLVMEAFPDDEDLE